MTDFGYAEPANLMMRRAIFPAVRTKALSLLAGFKHLARSTHDNIKTRDFVTPKSKR